MRTARECGGEREGGAGGPRLAALQSAAEQAPKADSADFLRRGEKASAQIDLDEAATRALIDQQLREAGWDADTKTLRYGAGSRPAKGRNLAIAEWATPKCPADYALFAGLTVVAVVEAKRQRKNVSAAIDQAERYSSSITPPAESVPLGAPWGEHKLPFVFAANGCEQPVQPA